MQLTTPHGALNLSDSLIKLKAKFISKEEIKSALAHRQITIMEFLDAQNFGVGKKMKINE